MEGLSGLVLQLGSQESGETRSGRLRRNGVGGNPGRGKGVSKMSILLDDLRSKKRVLTAEEIKALYTRICSFADMGDRSGDGWMDVRALEIAVGKEFRNTAEFHRIMANYFSRAVHGESQRTLSIGNRIKRKRIAIGMTQKQLADLLGVSQVQVVYYEKNTSPASTKVLEWLNGPSD